MGGQQTGITTIPGIFIVVVMAEGVRVTVRNLLSTFPKSFTVVDITAHFSKLYKNITNKQYPSIAFKFWAYKFKEKYYKKHGRRKAHFLSQEQSFLDGQVNPGKYASPEKKSRVSLKPYSELSEKQKRRRILKFEKETCEEFVTDVLKRAKFKSCVFC